MQQPFMRIPFTGALPAAKIVPSDASTPQRAISALAAFLSAPSRSNLSDATVILSGAGISVASGLADYRGSAGTYILNKTYRPIYFNEFIENHEARKRYWARSFLGWTTLHRARPNLAHDAVRDLGRLGLVRSVITQNVDSFHSKSHPDLKTIELHGYLRSLVCLSCRTHYSRELFQQDLSRLNPSWAAFLEDILTSGALDTEDPKERKAKGMKTNPDGDVDVKDAPYTTFRYPPCPNCLASPVLKDGNHERVEVDADGAWSNASTGGVLKPAVIMFGESIIPGVKVSAEKAVNEAGKLLVLGSSLATYSAWRLVKQAKERGMAIGVLNLGGVRGEAELFAGAIESSAAAVRIELPVEEVLPGVVKALASQGSPTKEPMKSERAF
ncbi:MAG: hypothetical protein M1814_006411 [Vezdaea aestivalis]|nr:MAG: hypothetical protein M1814_006411 [Vezdaea aestivalis]